MPAELMSPANPSRVVVVGAGIVGASIAYHLARSGADVVVIDGSLPASGATGASFGWIGRPRRPSADPLSPLQRMVLDEYRRLEREIPGLSVTWSGSLNWAAFAEDGVLGVDDVHALEPRLVGHPSLVQYRSEDGAVDPVVATERLIEAARECGAGTLFGTPVISLEHAGGAITGVQTTEATIAASTVVLAAGVGSVALCHGVGISLPVRADPAVLVRLRASPGAVRRIIAGEFEVRQAPDGTLLMPMEYTGEHDTDDLAAAAQRARTLLLDSFKGLADVEILSAEVGWRPMPLDGDPIIGPELAPVGLYLAVMHSGVTLAAAVGRLIAEEITTGSATAELAPCRRRV